jgi:protein TonB
MERVERQGEMKFGSNITFSAVVHVMIITAAMALAGRDAVSRAPEKYVAVTLIEHAAELRQGAVDEQGKEAAGEYARSVTWKRLRKPAVVPSPVRDRKETTPTPLPVERSSVRDDADAAKGRQVEVRGPNPGDQSGGFLTMSSGTMHVAVPGSEVRRGGPGAGEEKATGNDPRAVSAIRAAIERAKSYPPLAKRRNQEGTVVAEFSINAKGLPENVRVTRSSGFRLLDSAARETIVKAAPFPVVDGRIEVPINFVLK